MGTFSAYFPLGFHHIVGLTGFDHLLFVIVLCAVYELREWRRILALLTGFTLGHSLTLALTALHIIAFPSNVVEILIPLTILITSLSNIILPHAATIWRPFAIATAFGLIHGCGFAGYFTMMLGGEESIIGPLFAFNIGLEAGQITVVAALYLFRFLLEKIKPILRHDWILYLSGAGAGLAVKLILETM